ncbi:MAG: hypothetical protein ACTSPF_07515 [Candidatus Heimdallarchaeaceae archaeon]
MFRRQSPKKKDTTLWSEYPDYNPINNIEEKPLYDESLVTDEHRVLGQIIRENWSLIHPLSRDYMLSAAAEWRKFFTEKGMSPADSGDSNEVIDVMKQDFETKMQRILLEKNAEIEKVKMDVAESFKEQLEEKDKEFANYKMMAESVRTNLDDTKVSQTNIQSELSTSDRRIAVLEKLVEDLRDQCKSQEIESMNVQTGISKNFQLQISEMTTELYNRQEQIEKLRGVLSKAKDQLVNLKEKNGENILSRKQLEARIEALERMVTEKDDKLKQVVKSIESLE